MANDFSADASCKALWRFENGALIVDSIGGNTLTAQGTPAADLVDFKEGDASVELLKADFDYFDIADAALDAGFPFKNGDPNRNISCCFWFKHISLPTPAAHQSFFSKKDSLSFENRNVGTGGEFNFTLHDGIFYQFYLFGVVLQNDRWYHVGVTFQESDNSYRIRIWDDTAGALLGPDAVGNATDAVTNNWPLEIGHREALLVDANIDEMVVFDRVLSVTEIDKIRAGTYGGSGKLPIFGSLTNAFWFVKNKVGMMAKM